MPTRDTQYEFMLIDYELGCARGSHENPPSKLGQIQIAVEIIENFTLVILSFVGIFPINYKFHTSHWSRGARLYGAPMGQKCAAYYEFV
jgi:hypothetical protein